MKIVEKKYEPEFVSRYALQPGKVYRLHNPYADNNQDLYLAQVNGEMVNLGTGTWRAINSEDRYSEVQGYFVVEVG